MLHELCNLVSFALIYLDVTNNIVLFYRTRRASHLRSREVATSRKLAHRLAVDIKSTLFLRRILSQYVTDQALRRQLGYYVYSSEKYTTKISKVKQRQSQREYV